MRLIDQDIAHIERVATFQKLDHDTALDLTRYSGALLSIIKDTDGQEESHKKNLSKFTTEELLVMAKEMISGGKDDSVSKHPKNGSK